MTTERRDSILGQFGETARCRDAQHGDGVCCALAPQFVNICAALFGRDVERMKVGGDDGAVVDKVDRRWNDLDVASTVNDLPVLRQFIYRFTETRVRSELAERRRSLRSTLFLPHDSTRLKIPNYRGGVRGAPDVPRPLGSGRIEKILKSIIVQTISEKLCPYPRRRSACDDPNQLSSLIDAVRAPGADVLDSRSSSSDDGGSNGAPAVTEELDGGRGGPTGRKTRPKRGHYRKYNRQLLLDAVRAVQKGDMSVHRAGSYYGVPHSTLEYKVKERHLLRQRKTESTGAATGGSERGRRRTNVEEPRHPRPPRDSAVSEIDRAPRLGTEPADSYLTRLPTGSSPWPFSLADAVSEDPLPPWQRLFHLDQSALSTAGLRLPPPPPLLPFDLGRTLPVGFGWPPPPPLLAGMFPLAGDGAPPGVDSGRLPMLPGAGVHPSGVHPFSMSASDLLKSFQQKAAASGADGDVRDMADDRLLSLFPVLGGSQHGVASHAEDSGSPSQVAVG